MAHNKVYGFCESGCKVEVDPAEAVRPIERGGTGQKTQRGAEFAVNSGMTADTSAVTDTDNVVFKVASPSTTNGVFRSRKMSVVWAWIAQKIRSVFGFTESNVLPLKNGGFGGTTAAQARENIGAVNKAGDTMTGDLEIIDTQEGGKWPGFGIRASMAGYREESGINGNHHFWRKITEDGTGIIGYEFPDEDMTRMWFEKEAFCFDKPLAFDAASAAERAAIRKQTLKNLGLEIQCGTINSVGTTGKDVIFPEPFSGVPVVVASGGTETASVYVRDVTTTGCKLVSGKSDNNGVQWQAVYIAD